MKFIYLGLQILLLHGVNSGLVRKPPAFATPVYSDSYLPAAMQVIFHAVEQLKSLQIENDELPSSTTIPTTSPHAPGQHQPVVPTTTESKPEKPPLSQEPVIAENEKPITMGSTILADEKPELSGETPEMVHATPETNHETPEVSQEVDESNQENQVTPAPEVKPEVASNDGLESSSIMTTNETSKESSEESVESQKKKKEPSIDSVVQEIYGIVMPQNKSKDSSEESDESKDSIESKSNEDNSREDEEYDENRFTLLGEKVSQVPRPSLSTYLRKAKIPPRCSLQQLALLYDSLSKDARKQGFAKFAGYSDEVLKTLESSAEGGIGPQLQILLEKTVERNELTRDDAKMKIADTLKELKEPGSSINRDLRRLVPLQFKP